jgi:hypothetical protein
MSDSLQKAAMDGFVSRESIRRYRKLASEPTDAAERSRIMKLLAEEEAKFKSELSRSDNGPAARSRVSVATENQAEYDGEEKPPGGQP